MSAPPGSLFAGLVDDAALFPPGNAPMDVGLREHARHHAASYGEIVGPFLCPVSRVDEMVAMLPEDQRLELSLVVDLTGEAAHAALRTVAGDPRLRLAAVEASAERLGDDVATVGANLHRLPRVVGCLEVPRKGFGAALDYVCPTGWHAAKYRTGGVHAEDVPGEHELAGFLTECVRRGLPFKLTAGLHHAVRNTETSTGLEQHGVLNVLVATHAAATGHDIGAIAEVLDQRDADALVATVTAWSQQDALAVRRLFRSFGCCGVTDPIDELTELGLVGLATTEESRA